MTNKVTLDKDQTDALRNLIRHYAIEGDWERAIGLVRRDLEESVKITQSLVDEYPHLDYDKSLAISTAYLDFLSKAPLSFFK